MNAHGGQVWSPDGSRALRLDFSASLWPERLALPRLSRADLEPYPDPDCRALEAAASRHFGVPSQQLLACNGSTEALFLALRWLRPRRLTLFEPTFSEYERAALWAQGTKVRLQRVLSHPEDGFFPDLAAARGDTAVLCNPNNPTGRLYPRRLLALWLDANRAAGVRTLVDEAFLEMTPEPERNTLLPELPRWPGLLVLRSMTKRFGLAGVRLGFVFGAPAVIAALRAARIPWSVGTPAHRFGLALCRRPVDHDLAARVARAREFLAAGLARLGFTVFASEVNFLLLRMPRHRSNLRLVAALRQAGIGIRDAANFHGLDSSYLRCAVRPRAETRQLLTAIEAAL